MVKFEDAKKGYNKEQVDAYIKTINDEYQKVLAEYQALEEEMEENKKDTSQNDAIAAALINAEVIRKQTVADAEVEARSMKRKATIEVEKISMKKDMVLEEVGRLVQMLTDIIDGESDGEASVAEEAKDL